MRTLANPWRAPLAVGARRLAPCGDNTTMAHESQELVTQDGRSIAATFFLPHGAATASVLLVPAMGIRQDYYRALASWLAGHGFLAATFDFSGTGASLRGKLRQVDVSILDWAQFDCATMLEALSARLPGRPIFWIGHSLGAQIVPFVPNRRKIARLIAVASGSGYWRENTAALRWRAWLLWYLVAPAALPLFGYFPGRRLRMVGDLPAGVMRQWRRWCLHPQYAFGVEGPRAREQYAAVQTPITSLSFTDDEFMSARNTESLLGFYANAPISARRIAPEQVGAAQIGHFGFFRERFRDSMWKPYLLPELVPPG